MENREKFLKDLKRGVAGVVAGASIIGGATGCDDKKIEENNNSVTNPMPSEGVGRVTKAEQLAEQLKNMNSAEEIKDFIKEMYINIDNIKNPENNFDKENLEIILKQTQATCFYIAEKDAIVLRGDDYNATKIALNNLGEQYVEVNSDGSPLVVIAYNGKTIDGTGTVRDTEIDEAQIVLPENLNNVSAEGKTTAQEIPLTVMKKVLEVANYLENNPDNYTKTVVIPELCDKISEDIYAYGLQEYMPELKENKSIEDYVFLENNDDEGR